MKKNIKFLILPILTGLFAAVVPANAQTVTWGTSANTTPMSFTSTGAVDNLTWELGWFNGGFTPDFNNALTWSANWNPVATSQYTDFGSFWAVAINTFNVGAAAANQQMYIFAYNDLGQIGSNGGEALLFTEGSLFPGAPDFESFDVADNPTDSADDNFIVVVGQVDRQVGAAGGVVRGEGIAADEKADSVTASPNATFETQSFTWAIKDEVIFIAAPDILMGSLFTRLPTLEQRVGERIWLRELGQGTTPNGAVPAMALNTEVIDGVEQPQFAGEQHPSNPLLDAGWLRVIYDQVTGNIGSGRSYRSEFMGLQAGLDRPLRRHKKGIWVLGLTGQLGALEADASSANLSGSLETEGYGLGLTATWHGDDGVYADFQSQYNFLSSDYSTGNDRDFASNEDAAVLALSMELGRRHVLQERAGYAPYMRRRSSAPMPAQALETGESWGLTPQVQLQWSRMSEQSFTDSLGKNPVVIGAQEQVIGRLGLAIDYRNSEGPGSPTRKIYGIVNIHHRFSEDPVSHFSGERFTAEGEPTWGEIGLGGSYTWYKQAEDQLIELYGEVAFRRAAGSSGSYGTFAELGARIAW